MDTDRFFLGLQKSKKRSGRKRGKDRDKKWEYPWDGDMCDGGGSSATLVFLSFLSWVSINSLKWTFATLSKCIFVRFPRRRYLHGDKDKERRKKKESEVEDDDDVMTTYGRLWLCELFVKTQTNSSPGKFHQQIISPTAAAAAAVSSSFFVVFLSLLSVSSIQSGRFSCGSQEKKEKIYLWCRMLGKCTGQG